MKQTKRLIGMLGFALCGALLGDNSCTYAAVSVSIGVEIRAQSDFYEPLTPYGEWVAIGSYGQCWRPSRMEAGWRPYCNGYWQRTDAGWFWASDEPWGWATYHYGRWNFSDEFGWYWVPQTEWAPAWVSWHRGGGYVGWEPLYMSDVRVRSPRAYIVVEERHFLEPVRSSTVIVNNTTIINQTVINEAPTTAVIEKASGRKLQALPVQEVRYKAEAPVAAKQKTALALSPRNILAPAGNETQPAGKKGVVVAPAQSQPQLAKPGVAVAAHQPPMPAPKHLATQDEKFKPIPPAPESRPALQPEPKAEGSHPGVSKEPAGQPANKPALRQERPAQPTPRKTPIQPPANEKTPPGDKNESNPPDKGHENKGKE